MSAQDALADRGPYGSRVPLPGPSPASRDSAPSSPRAAKSCRSSPSPSLHLPILRAWSAQSFPPPDSHATLSRTVFSVLTPSPEKSTLQAAAKRFMEAVLRPSAPLLRFPGNAVGPLFSSQEKYFRSQNLPFLSCPSCFSWSHLASILTSLKLFLSRSPKTSNA